MISTRPRILLWIAGIFGGALALLRLGTHPGDFGHALFGDALCGPWG